MNAGPKILLYVFCTGLTAYFGMSFIKGFSARMDAGAQRFDSLTGSVEAEGSDAEHATNASADSTAVMVTNSTGAPSANLAAAPTSAPPVAATTNFRSTSVAKPDLASRPAKPPESAIGLDAALALAGVLGLAILIARDVSHYAAQRTHQFMYNEEGKGISDPLYDQAEQTWANGDHLEAIRLLRDFLARNPRELHARLRIAEIYEKDLNNALAAALEYEDILATRFDPDRWGWSAIHLCNLYARLNQPAKMDEWMQRVVNEVPQTAAARKAREKLGLPEDYQPAAAAGVAPESEEATGGLPPGFRPKKS
jgi:hypothetical protein